MAGGKEMTTFEEQFARHMFNGEMLLKNNWEWPTYGWCPEGHAFSDTIQITPDMVEQLTADPTDPIYPNEWCETCQKWYPGRYPAKVVEIEEDKCLKEVT
jgi:hypothetical protein